MPADNAEVDLIQQDCNGDRGSDSYKAFMCFMAHGPYRSYFDLALKDDLPSIHNNYKFASAEGPQAQNGSGKADSIICLRPALFSCGSTGLIDH
jgi:hypothetical protein